MAFAYDDKSLLMSIEAKSVPIILVGSDKTPYFRCNDAAQVLGYSNYYKAVAKHVRPRQTRTLSDLLKEVCPILGGPSQPDQNDLKTKYMTEAGLYRLIARSKMPFAELFQDWVEEEVLPSIRKTGSYSVQTAAPAAKECDSWVGKRLEGKELMKLKNASLQQLIAGGLGPTGKDVYPMVANHINQAVVGFTETTAQFKRQQQLPKHISVPDILNMQGQVARCYAETCFHKFVTDNLQRLRELSQQDLTKEFTDLKLNLRQGFVSTGMGDLQTKLLTVEEAKKRKRDAGTQRRKQQKLLQAGQPIAIECAA
jgi:prophage antirepressor-like protein